MFQIFGDAINQWVATLEEAKAIAKQHTDTNQDALVQVADWQRRWSDTMNCIVKSKTMCLWYKNGVQQP